MQDMNKRLLLEPAQKAFERAQKLEHEFGEYYTGKSSLFLYVIYIYAIFLVNIGPNPNNLYTCESIIEVIYWNSSCMQIVILEHFLYMNHIVKVLV